METKVCKKCGAEKSLDEFYTHPRAIDGRQGSCMSCFKIQRDEYRNRNKRDLKDSHLRSFYNIDLDQALEIFYAQGGLCAVCQKQLDFWSNKTNVDHCHKTGKVRGILCSSCNTSIGKLGDTVEGVRKALYYLENFDENLHHRR